MTNLIEDLNEMNYIREELLNNIFKTVGYEFNVLNTKEYLKARKQIHSVTGLYYFDDLIKEYFCEVS